MFEFIDYDKKVRNVPIICSLEFSFDGKIEPMTIKGIQAFYDSVWLYGEFYHSYFTKSSFSFGEKTIYSTAGHSYEQILKIRFPSNDNNRSKRVIGLEEIKFVKLNLNDERSVILGRNDYTQNAKMKLDIESTLQLTEVTFTNISLTPIGFIYE